MVTPVSSVVTQIYEHLQRDPRTKSAVIEVSFHQGVVDLSGNVKSVKIAQAAEEIARELPGVISVTNELKVG